MEQLGRYVDGVLGPDEQWAAVVHVRECPSCQAELALWQSVTSGPAGPEEADVVRHGVARLEHRASEVFGKLVKASPVRSWSGVGLRPFAVAAALLVAAGGLYVGVGKAPELPPTVTSGGEVTRSLSVVVRGPVGDQAEAPERLEWLAVEGAVRYRVRLMEVDRREVWSASTSALAAELPSSVRAALTPGRTLLWDVTAYSGSEAAIAASGTQSFRVVLR
jgi:hypothetical protein